MTANKYLFGLFLALITTLTTGYFVEEYSGFTALRNKSQAILITQCQTTPKLLVTTNGVGIENPVGGITTSEMEVVSVLKGQPAMRAKEIRLESRLSPRQGEYYLIFAESCDEHICQAFADFRVVPIGLYFETNSIASKTPDEAIRYIMEGRIYRIEREIPTLQAEKERLESVLKELKAK